MMMKPNPADYPLTIEGDLQYATDLENWQSVQRNRPQPNMTTIQIPLDEYEKLKAVLDAAINLRNVKGRHHSEIACHKLYASIDTAIKQEGGE